MNTRLFCASKVLFFFALVLAAIFLSSCAVYDISDEKWRDNDSIFRGNLQLIQENNIQFRLETITVGKLAFKMSVFSKKGPRDIRFIICHDSEDAALDAGLREIVDGGTLVAFENEEMRNLYDQKKHKETSQDPNRMFFENGFYWPLASRAIDILLEGRASGMEFLFALHNNRPDGSFNLTNLKKQKNVSVVSEADLNRKNVIWISGRDKKPTASISAEIEFYKQAGLNVIYEYVPINKKGTGSLSIYAAKKNIPYINIEVLAGKKGDTESEREALERQMRYLAKVREYHSF